MSLKIFYKKIISLILIFCIFSTLGGCEAFRRKFVRKKKTPDEPIEMILEPQAYPDVPVVSEAMYREYFTFWKSWHTELISFLEKGANVKKQKECIQEAVMNLTKLSQLLQEELSNKLIRYIKELQGIKSQIDTGNLSSDTTNILRRKLEDLKFRIDKEFVYSKVKDNIK